jgi:hypothetical protein
MNLNSLLFLSKKIVKSMMLYSNEEIETELVNVVAILEKLGDTYSEFYGSLSESLDLLL